MPLKDALVEAAHRRFRPITAWAPASGQGVKGIIVKAYWSVRVEELLANLASRPEGFSSQEARRGAEGARAGRLRASGRTGAIVLLLAQFKSPIVVLLIVAAGLSLYLHDAVDAAIILAITVVSGLLGFWQEHGAARAVNKLLSLVRVTVRVLRDGVQAEVPAEDVVPGDVVLLSAGATVAGDCRILESTDLSVDEATLTGESFPAAKGAGEVAEDAPMAGRTNSLFMGTHVVSGTATAVVVSTGRETEFGRISERLRLRPAETEFERGVRRFGHFLMELTLVMVLAIFAFNLFFHRPLLDSILFSLALAVGLTPQLLPAIIGVNLARGAARMAEARVIVKRLASIENFGSMDVLCSDKTGTLTQGRAAVHSALDVRGAASEKVLLYATINAYYETGFANPIDQALREGDTSGVARYAKVAEMPYDFLRKRLSILVALQGKGLLITKGAFDSVLSICARAEDVSGALCPIDDARTEALRRYAELSARGLRVLGVAYRQLDAVTGIRVEHEADMIFVGFLVFEDPPKEDTARTVAELRRLGVALKIITGDNRLVAAAVARAVGLDPERLLTGADLRQMKDEALIARAGAIELFAETEPNQKERIILALKKAGHVVGYLGDGINDASALHGADVGISVDGAADVAKSAADIILLDKDLSVLARGVVEGRKTFANTLKYVFMATSANFGNMFSMAIGSLVLPFLPLLPKQILLTNLLTDFPEMAIATDKVDPPMLEQPRRWDLRSIRRFMLTFGPLSSVFDLATFAVLMLVLKASPAQFRTGWFLESVISACLIVLVVRTRRPFVASRPGRALVLATLAAIVATLALPLTPLGALFGFEPLPPLFFVVLLGIVGAYTVSAEALKRWFYRTPRSARGSRG
jgi:P-type Mg2+ transporter